MTIVPPEVKSAIPNARRILLIGHIMPDGDAIGSLLGLGWALRKLGKECTLACADPLPNRYLFLPGARDIYPARLSNEDLIIALDSSDRERLGAIYDAAAFSQRPLLVIDHHITNVRFGNVNWVGETASTAEMCFALLGELGVSLDTTIATCLLSGVVADTRCFRTANTTAEVLRTAVALMEAGASLSQITEQVFQQNSLARICLWGKALADAQISDRIIWTEISLAMMRECHATWEDGEELVSFLGSTRDADVAILFREKENGAAEASMRAARGVDISGVAFGLGGGGHPQAAGCTCQGNLAEVREKVLVATRQALREQGRIP